MGSSKSLGNDFFVNRDTLKKIVLGICLKRLPVVAKILNLGALGTTDLTAWGKQSTTVSIHSKL